MTTRPKAPDERHNQEINANRSEEEPESVSLGLIYIFGCYRIMLMAPLPLGISFTLSLLVLRHGAPWSLCSCYPVRRLSINAR